VACKYHEDGWHKSLIILRYTDADANVKQVEHTCACWLPAYLNYDGKMYLEADMPKSFERWAWQDGNKIPLDAFLLENA